MPTGNDLICFKQLRRTAKVVKESQCCQGDESRFTKTISQGLQSELGSNGSDDQTKIIVLLALMEWQRLSGLPLELPSIFQSIANYIQNGTSCAVRQSISANYDTAELKTLVDWLIQRVGALASEAAAEMKRDKRRAFKSSSFSRIEPPAVILNLLCIMNQEMKGELSTSYFHVVALNDYLQAGSWDEEIVRSCCRFREIISITTKLHLLSYNFQSTRLKQDREQLYSDIYYGSNYQRNRAGNNNSNTKHRLLVRRDHVISDSMELSQLEDGSLLSGIHVEFEGEEGEDAGGLTKEWILLITMQLIGKVFRRVETSADRLEINPNGLLSEAELMGVVLGLSLLLQIVVDISLPTFVIRSLLSRQPRHCTLEDLREIRPTLADGLAQILEWEEEGFSEKLSLNFTCSTTQDATVELIQDGENIPVTYFNRDLYVERMCQFTVMEESKAQVDGLCHGFERVCQGLPSLQLFPTHEFDNLIRGQEVPLTVASIKRLCKVEGQIPNDNYLEQFWSIFEDDQNPKAFKSLLQFVTANHRIPLVSGKESILFQIVVLQGQEFINRLPTASTCTNTLFLPHYPNKEMLQSRLLTAVRHGTVGFGLK